MRWIDLKNAIENKTVDNFGVLLFRLLLKSDSENWAKLRKGFPLEAEMARIYKEECPYIEGGARMTVDWEKIEGLALVSIQLNGF